MKAEAAEAAEAYRAWEWDGDANSDDAAVEESNDGRLDDGDDCMDDSAWDCADVLNDADQSPTSISPSKDPSLPASAPPFSPLPCIAPPHPP